MPSKTAQQILEAAETMSQKLAELSFSDPVSHVYNPLEYAWASHRKYIEMYAKRTCKILMMGMNPGPWGMAQTGIPFGEIAAVRQWLKIDETIMAPAEQHPKRPILGMQCERSEVSGRRFWGLFSQRFGDPKTFFRDHFVTNYCPLAFMESSARNLTPDKLPQKHREAVERICDEHLTAVVGALRPQWLIGIGGYAEKCFRRVRPDIDIPEDRIGRVLHPSPASPAANRGWDRVMVQQMEALGLW